MLLPLPLILLATCNDFLWLVFNSRYRNIIDYRDNLATILQNIVIMFFWLSHRPSYIREYHYTVSAIGDHFLYRTFLKMVADYAKILQECSNFCKKTAKKFVLPPIFQKVRLEVHKKFTFVEYVWYGTTGINTEVD